MHYLFFLLPVVLLLLCSSQSPRAPFQSDKVKEICSHMTSEEKRRAANRSAAFGFFLGGLFVAVGLVGMLVGKWLFDSSLIGMMMLPPIAMIILALFFKPRIDKSNREFFASTQWSKENGINSDSIVLRRL